ncbi:hypothetical protein D3C71_1927880 [compost metagenome]
MGIKSPFEVTEAMENFTPSEGEFDEHAMMYRVLSQSFERYGIDIDPNDFKLQGSTSCKCTYGW